MKMYIDGAAADASNGEVIEVLNPATGELIDTVPSATQEDVSRAVTAAVAGEKAWAAVPLHRRMAMMQRFIDLVMEEENHKRLALVQSREMGKPYKESTTSAASKLTLRALSQPRGTTSRGLSSPSAYRPAWRTTSTSLYASQSAP